VFNDGLDDEMRRDNIQPAIDTLALFRLQDPRFQKWLSIARHDVEVVEMALCDAWQKYPIRHREYLERVQSYGIRLDIPPVRS